MRETAQRSYEARGHAFSRKFKKPFLQISQSTCKDQGDVAVQLREQIRESLNLTVFPNQRARFLCCSRTAGMDPRMPFGVHTHYLAFGADAQQCLVAVRTDLGLFYATRLQEEQALYWLALCVQWFTPTKSPKIRQVRNLEAFPL